MDLKTFASAPSNNSTVPKNVKNGSSLRQPAIFSTPAFSQIERNRYSDMNLASGDRLQSPNDGYKIVPAPGLVPAHQWMLSNNNNISQFKEQDSSLNSSFFTAVSPNSQDSFYSLPHSNPRSTPPSKLTPNQMFDSAYFDWTASSSSPMTNATVLKPFVDTPSCQSANRSRDSSFCGADFFAAQPVDNSFDSELNPEAVPFVPMDVGRGTAIFTLDESDQNSLNDLDSASDSVDFVDLQQPIVVEKKPINKFDVKRYFFNV